MIGDVRVVDDVPVSFAGLVQAAAPRTLALSGGGTAERCYHVLRRAGGIDWASVDVLVGDERWVPVDHPDSNEGMARRALLDHVPAAAVRSMREAAGVGGTIDAAAEAYDALLRGYELLDLVHLGLGDDAHTASLFPGSPALDVTEGLVAATGDPDHPHRRLTLTYPGIARFRMAVVTVEGDEKAEALDRVRRGEDVPAARIEAGEVIWLVNHDAAGEA